MRYFILICAISLLSNLSHADQSEIGKVILSLGQNLAVSPEGKERALKRNSKIFSDDLLKTGVKGRLQVRFTDGSRLALKPNTEFKVAQYRFDEQTPEDSEAIYKLLKGGMRTISGKIGKVDREDYRLETVIATIGIRGTDFQVELNKDKLSGAVNDGAINVKGLADERDIRAGQSFQLNFGTRQEIRVFKTPTIVSQQDRSGVRSTAVTEGSAEKQAEASVETSSLVSGENSFGALPTVDPNQEAKSTTEQVTAETVTEPTVPGDSGADSGAADDTEVDTDTDSTPTAPDDGPSTPPAPDEPTEPVDGSADSDSDVSNGESNEPGIDPNTPDDDTSDPVTDQDPDPVSGNGATDSGENSTSTPTTPNDTTDPGEDTTSGSLDSSDDSGNPTEGNSGEGSGDNSGGATGGSTGESTGESTGGATGGSTSDGNSGSSTVTNAPLGSAVTVGFVEVDSANGIRSSSGVIYADGRSSFSVSGTPEVVTQIQYFDSNPGISDDNCDPCELDTIVEPDEGVRNSGSVNYEGTNVSWGRWLNGRFAIVKNGAIQEVTSDLHFMYADKLTTADQVAAVAESKSGSYLYAFPEGSDRLTSPQAEGGLTGSLEPHHLADNPVDGTVMNAGTFVIVDWDSQLISKASIEALIQDSTGVRIYQLINDANQGSIELSKLLDGDSVKLLGSCSGGQCTVQGVNTDLSGHMNLDFIGEAANAAITSYGANGETLSGDSVNVTGTVLLEDKGQAQ